MIAGSVVKGLNLFLHKLSIGSKWAKQFCIIHSFLFQLYEHEIYANAKQFYGTHYDAMELLEIGKWKMEIY